MRFAPTMQQLVFDRFDLCPDFAIPSCAVARNAYGNAAQEIVCAALALDPIPITGKADVCFDAVARGMHYEIKSVRKGDKMVVYDWRLRKELGAGVPLQYAILEHGVRGAKSSHEMWDQYSDHVLRCYLLPVALVHEHASKCPLVVPPPPKTDKGKRFGYNRAGYCEGYRNVPVRAFAPFTQPQEFVRWQMYGRNLELEVWR
jgi:hypothetical protein